MHGLISKISICYWQDQPDYYIPSELQRSSSGYRKGVSETNKSLARCRSSKESLHFACARVTCNLQTKTRSTKFEKTQNLILTCNVLVQDRTIRRSTTKLNCDLRFSYVHPISLGYRYNNSFLLEVLRPSTITTTL